MPSINNNMKKLFYLFFVLSIISCGGPNESSTYRNNSDFEEGSGNDFDLYEDEDFQGDPDRFEDGTYSATVDYYNPTTGYSATYSLTVEVFNNQVTTIYFPNDGYLRSK